MQSPDTTDAAETSPELADSGAVPCADQPLALRVEVVLLTNDRPVTEPKLVEMLGLKSGKKGDAAAQVREAIDALNADYAAQGRAFRVERLAGGYQMLTSPAFAPLLARVRGLRQQGRLTSAALETLAIIAYRSPCCAASWRRSAAWPAARC